MIGPFVKWAGGKSKLADELQSRMPEKYGKYIEPFVGGGAMFFKISPDAAVINDINPKLINCYRYIQKNPKAVVRMLDGLEAEFNALETIEEKADYYYRKRDIFNEKQPSLLTAGLFIFLNKTCFNGLYRENRTGQFNVPFGKKKQVKLCEESNIYGISELLRKAEIRCMDFETVFETDAVTASDFVFFDSPYAETFTNYNSGGFMHEDHVRLRDIFERLSERNVYCMATNNSCQYVRDLYKKWHIEEVDVMHAINRNGNDRMAKEVIITNY